MTNEDINLRKQEIHLLNQKHKQEVEDMRSSLNYNQMNQSRVLDSLWAKVIMKNIFNDIFDLFQSSGCGNGKRPGSKRTNKLRRWIYFY